MEIAVVAPLVVMLFFDVFDEGFFEFCWSGAFFLFFFCFCFFCFFFFNPSCICLGKMRLKIEHFLFRQGY